MNAAVDASTLVRKAAHKFVPLDEIDLSQTIRPYMRPSSQSWRNRSARLDYRRRLPGSRDGQHILVADRNRLEALRLMGAKEAPVRIVDFTDIEAQLWQLSENLHRAELTKLQYDQQVVKYAELLKARQAGETAAPIRPPANEIPAEVVSRQVAAVSEIQTEDQPELRQASGFLRKQNCVSLPQFLVGGEIREVTVKRPVS
jgi:hypothetical protein